MKAHFGKQIKAARQAKGYTQEALGRLIGIEGNSIARIERGANPIRWENLEKLVQVLGQSPAYYFSDKKPDLIKTAPNREELLVSLFQEALKLDYDGLVTILAAVEVRAKNVNSKPVSSLKDSK